MTPIIIEQFSRVAPLGVRFWDVSARSPVTRGLVVTAFGPSGRPLPLFANSKGAYILQDVPGLREFEMGDGSEEFWADAPPQQPYTLQVLDTEGRFHTLQFEASVPTRGLFSWVCILSPPLAPLDIPPGFLPAYPAPTVPVPAGAASLSADLYDPQAGKPASWAVLEVLLDGEVLGRGIADARGSVVVVFAYPEPLDTTPGSPMTFGVPLLEQVWTLGLRAYYEPTDPMPVVPELCAVLSQREANLWRKWNSPADNEPFTTLELPYGSPVVARSVDAGDHELSRLYITPV